MADSDYTVRGSSAMTTMSLTTAAVTPLQTVVSIYGTKEVEPNSIYVGMAAMIGDEIVRVDGFSASSITIARGCADTIPAAHAADQPIWFIGMTVGSDSREYVATETVGVKVLPYTPSNNPMALGAVPPRVLTFNYRFARPYPPGNVLCDGLPWFSSKPVITDANGGTTITWTHRDRIVQSDQLIEHEAGDIGPEVGTVYTAIVYNLAGVLQRFMTGITGTSLFYPIADAEVDIAPTIGLPRKGYITLVSSRAGYDSLQPYSIPFSLTVGDTHYNSVVLLLHGDGTDSSTVILDSSPAPISITASGDALITTSIFKTGGSSIALPGTASSYLTLTTSNGEFAFGAGDFTIESWVNTSNIDTQPGFIISKLSDFLLVINQTTGFVTFQVYEPSFTTHTITSNVAVVINTWTHIAVSRVGSVTRLFIDGVPQTETLSLAYTMNNVSSEVTIGVDATGGSNYLIGQVDEMRITKWIGRYTTAFTPTAKIFTEIWADPVHGAVVLMLHGEDGLATEGSTNIIDSSDYARVVTPVGTGAKLTTGLAGVIGVGALNCPGEVNWYTVPSHSDFDLAVGDFTIEFGYLPYAFPSAGQFDTLFARANSESDYAYWAAVSAPSEGYVGLQVYTPLGVLLAANVAGILNLNQFTRIAIVRDSGVYRLYVNGLQMDTSASIPITDIDTPFCIGALTATGQQVCDGAFDEFRVTKGICRYPNGSPYVVQRLPFPDLT